MIDSTVFVILASTPDAFQRTACRDELHRIFLFQAVWSAILATRLDPGRLRLLPADYSYPYNLHEAVPLEHRATVLNDLTHFVFEERPIVPKQLHDIQVREPLRCWLAVHTGEGNG